MSQNKPLNRCNNCNSKIPDEQMELIKENQEAVFCSFCGDYLYVKKKFVDNQTSNNEFLNNNKSTNINQYKRETFEHYITLFAARIIYDSIIQADLKSKPMESYIDKLASALRKYFLEKPLNHEWLGVFRNNSRKKFKKRYKEFQTSLKRNVKYRENFLTFSKNLIKSMLELMHTEKELSTLKGIERDIANDLINRKLFENDKRFPEVFKQNLIIALSRLIYIKMKYMAQKRNAKVSLIDLDQNVIAKMAEAIKNNVITLTEINPKYINKLYGITLNQFNTAYQTLRTELNASKIYSESFRYFIQRLIKNVNLLLSGKRESGSLTNLEQVIIKYLDSFKNEDISSMKENSKIEDAENKGKWDFLDVNESGESLTHQQSIHATGKYLNKIIIPDLIERKILNPGQRPTTRHIRMGHSGFLYALKDNNRNISYNDVAEAAGFMRTQTKYSFLYEDKHGNSLNRKDKLTAAKNYFNSVIIPDLIKKQKILFNQIPSTEIIRRTSHRSFIDVLLKSTCPKCKIQYKDFLIFAGYRTVMGKIIWTFLDRNEKGNSLSYDEKLEIATNYLLNKIVPDLVEKEKISEDQIPFREILEKSEYYLYIKALKKRNINYGDVLENAGYVYKEEIKEMDSLEEINNFSKIQKQYNPDFEKWSFLYRKNDGKLLSREETLKEVSRFLLNVIIPELNEKGVLKPSDVPRHTDLSENGYGGLLTILGGGKWDIKFNEILKVAGLKLKKDTLSYRFLDLDENNKYLKKNDQISKAAENLRNIIIPDLIKKKKISINETPTKEILMTTKYKKFIWAIEGRRIRLNDVLRSAGLKINKSSDKWSFLYIDEQGNQLSYKETINVATSYFKNEIISELVKNGKLKKGEVPFRDLINSYSGFLYALWDGKWNISYTELVEAAGFIPNEGPILSKVGQNFHWIAERILLEHTRSKNCSSFYESLGYDNAIIVDESFKKLSKLALDLTKKYGEIKIIILDYYLGNSRENIDKHISRGYQSKFRLLLLLPLYAQESSTLSKLKYVELLDSQTFIKLIGLKGNLLEEFNETIGLAKSAVYNVDARIELRRKAIESRNLIKQIYNYKNKRFLDYLKNNNLYYVIT